MDGSSASCTATNAAAGNKPVTFVQQLPGRMRVNEGESVELQVVLSGEKLITFFYDLIDD